MRVMIKHLILKNLFRLRSFMQEGIQESILAELRGMRGEVARLSSAYEGLSGAYERLRGDHGELREALDRLELCDQTLQTIENGLLSLALQPAREAEPVPRKLLKSA